MPIWTGRRAPRRREYSSTPGRCAPPARASWFSVRCMTKWCNAWRSAQEEIFGPVLAVIPFDDEADALRIANGTAYSLAAGVWSSDTGRVHRMAAGLKAGTVWINTYGYTDVRLPWGGSGESGFGREHGESAIENFTEPKSVWLALEQ